MFFPKFKRHAEADYYSERNSFYADYRRNYTKITLDCLERCAYCDITVEESGGDEMQLDHFRPQKHFKHLSTHPYNLYLACPKCNGLKKDDWPATRKDNEPSFLGSLGYIDRVTEDAAKYFFVEASGIITPLNNPASYIIKKLHLNRNSRVNVRRKRRIILEKAKITKDARDLLLTIKNELSSGLIDDQKALEKYELAIALVVRLSELK